MRPDRLVLVAGTGTEVGKTWLAAALAHRLHTLGLRVAARKPVQSFDPDDATTDADVLAAATGEAPAAVCPPHRWLPVPMAPPIAAAIADQPPFTIAQLTTELEWPAGTDVGLVESAGGVCSPLADDGDTAAMADALRPDLVILVADARLGAIHAVRSALPPLAGHDVVVVLNRFEPDDRIHVENHRWLTSRDRIDAVTDRDLDAITERIHPLVPTESR